MESKTKLISFEITCSAVSSIPVRLSASEYEIYPLIRLVSSNFCKELSFENNQDVVITIHKVEEEHHV